MKLIRSKIITSAFLLACGMPAVAAETSADTESAQIQAQISVTITCEIDPIAVDFGNLQNLTQADFKQYKSAVVSYECKNIPAGTKIRLRHSNVGYYTGTHIITDHKTTINGQEFNYHLGLKHATNGANASDPSFLYEWTAWGDIPSQKFNQNIDFLLELSEIEQMNAAIAASGGSHTINLAVPFEVKVE